MFPYYAFWFLLFICSYVEIFPEQKIETRKAINIVVFILVSFIFCFFTGFKGEVGIDYKGYVNMFSNYADKPYSNRVTLQVEPIFWFLMHIFSILNQPFYVFWAFISIIGIIIKLIFFKKLSPFFILSLLIYMTGLFLERDFDGIRQGFSIGIAYIGLLFLLKKKYMLYYLFLLFGIFTHYTSLIFIISPLLIRIYLPKKIYILSIVVGFIIIFFHIDFVKLLVNFLPSGYIKTRLDTYINVSSFAGRIGLNIGILVRIFIFIIFLNTDYKTFDIPQKIYYLLLNGFFVSIMFFLLFNSTNIIAHRLAYGFREFQILIIPIIFSRIKRVDRQFILPCIGGYTLFLLYRMLHQPDVMHLFYYSLFFN